MEKEKIILKFLERRYGPIRHYYSDPFKILISCILSQRTREENTARASKALFSRASTPKGISRMSIKEIERLIKPSGSYRKKAKNIKLVARTIIEKYGGKVPKSREELMSLPGVGWKTSAIVMSYGFGEPIIAVDTHVNRISKRLGLAKEGDSVEAVREKLERTFPKRKWHAINLGMVKFGREICLPRNPKCFKCSLLKICPYGQKKVKIGKKKI